MEYNLVTDMSSGKTMEERYQMRKKLYDTKDAFVEESNDTNEALLNMIDDKEEAQAIQRYVEKGKDMLKVELDKYKELTLKSINLHEFESMTKNACLECQQRLSLIMTCFDRNDQRNVGDIQDSIDGALFAIGEIACIIDKTIAAEKETLETAMNKNRSALKYMAKTYNIIKTTNTCHVCPICLTSEVSIFCDPCGHSYCDKCLTNSHYCYICRVKVQKIHSLFFP